MPPISQKVVPTFFLLAAIAFADEADRRRDLVTPGNFGTTDPVSNIVSAALLILQTPSRKLSLPSEGHCQIHDPDGAMGDSPCAHLTLTFEDKAGSGLRIQTDADGNFRLPEALQQGRELRLRRTFKIHQAELVPLGGRRTRLDLAVTPLTPAPSAARTP